MIITLIFIKLAFIKIINADEENKNSAVLEPGGKYNVTWFVDNSNKMITFEVNVETTGYVGFGINSNNGGMKGADIVIGGVNFDGSTYFKDRHGIGNTVPIIDKSQDWNLLESEEMNGFTYLKFSRRLDTCDFQDVAITGDAQRFIWAFGADDDIEYHAANRGSYLINMLDPPSDSIDLSGFERFSLTTKVIMPEKDTVYWCTMIRSPKFAQKQHAVALGPKIESDLAKRHTHHFAVSRCVAPPGENAETFFKKFVSAGGSDCAFDGRVRSSPMYQYCSDFIYTWAMGARILYFPENVGFPIAENGQEFYLLEIHVDNSQRLKNKVFQTGMQFYHTSNLRKIEAGVFLVGTSAEWQLVIPPVSTNFTVATHCDSSICGKYIHPNGYTIFNVHLHAHNSAKRMRLRHFRDNIELPYIQDDQNYNNNFQENRNIPLRQFIPGDQLTLECGYDNTWVHPPGTVIGGYSTREEMCDATLYYYPKGNLYSCGSSPFENALLDIFGIKNITNVKGSTNPVITDPAELSGTRYLDHLDNVIEWTPALRKRLERAMTVGPHLPFCQANDESFSEQDLKNKFLNSNGAEEEFYPPLVSYPRNLKLYKKFDECRNNDYTDEKLNINDESKSRAKSFTSFPAFLGIPAM